MTQISYFFTLLKSHRFHRFTQIFSFTFLPYKSHADCADDAVFLPLKFPRRRSQPAKHGEGKKRAVPRRSHPAKHGEGKEQAVPRRSHPAKHGEGKKQAVPRRSHPAKYGEGFDAPPTLERSGSEHRRAVTSFPSEKGRLG